MLDSELERLEEAALRRHLEAVAERHQREKQRRAQAAAVAEARAQTQALQEVTAVVEAAAEAELLYEMLESDLLLDALGRRTLAIAGSDFAEPAYYNPFYGYPTRQQSTSYQTEEPQLIVIQESQQPVQARRAVRSSEPSYYDPFEAPQHRRMPALYAHETEPSYFKEREEDASLDRLARELIAADAARRRRQTVGTLPSHAAGGSSQTSASTAWNDGGDVYVLDDGSLGDLGYLREASAEPSSAPGPGEGGAAKAPTASADTSDLPFHQDYQVEEPRGKTRERAATVLDEEEEERLETEGIPVGPGSSAAEQRPSKIVKTD